MKKIKIPDKEYIAMFESKIVKSGNGGVAKAYKKYVDHDTIILVKPKKDLITSEKIAKKWEKYEN